MTTLNPAYVRVVVDHFRPRMKAEQDDRYPWLAAVRSLLSAAVAHDKSTLGICLGAQLLAVAAGFLGAANPPLDAARIDVVPRRLLGRAEGLRSLLRNSADASAPAAFGVVAGHLGLRSTLLVMSSTMLAGGLIGVAAVRSYPGDAARANAPAPPASP